MRCWRQLNEEYISEIIDLHSVLRIHTWLDWWIWNWIQIESNAYLSVCEVVCLSAAVERGDGDDEVKWLSEIDEGSDRCDLLLVQLVTRQQLEEEEEQGCDWSEHQTLILVADEDVWRECVWYVKWSISMWYVVGWHWVCQHKQTISLHLQRT